MHQKKKIILLFFIFLIFILDGIYILNQGTCSIVTRFGKVIKQDHEPGLKLKIPIFNKIKVFDKKMQNIVFNMSDNSEVVALDQKTMKLDAYAKYKIVNPKKFYESTYNNTLFRSKMNSIIESCIREVIGRTMFKDILAKKRNEIRRDVIKLVNRDIKKFGVNIIDIRIIRVNLPDKARNAVYARMRTEREKEAKDIRAKGMQKSDMIRATADKEGSIILSEAKKESEIVKGQGDAKSITIYSSVYSKDHGFYNYYKMLEIYKSFLGKKNDLVVLSTENRIFKYMNYY